MPHVTIEMNLDNDEFRGLDEEQIRRKVAKFASDAVKKLRYPADENKIMDINGNAVGTCIMVQGKRTCDIYSLSVPTLRKIAKTCNDYYFVNTLPGGEWDSAADFVDELYQDFKEWH